MHELLLTSIAALAAGASASEPIVVALTPKSPTAAASLRCDVEALGIRLTVLAAEPLQLEAAARDVALRLARHFAAALLLRQADWSLRHGDETRAAAARRFIASRAEPPTTYDLADDALLAAGN